MNLILNVSLIYVYNVVAHGFILPVCFCKRICFLVVYHKTRNVMIS